MVGEEGEQLGIVSIADARARAETAELDLVEIAPTANPPVCRIMDYGKFKYDQHKKQRQSRKHQSTTRVKEIKFHANVEDHDFETKIRHATEFLETGNRVKFSLFFRGRENAHQEMGFAGSSGGLASKRPQVSVASTSFRWTAHHWVNGLIT